MVAIQANPRDQRGSPATNPTIRPSTMLSGEPLGEGQNRHQIQGAARVFIKAGMCSICGVPEVEDGSRKDFHKIRRITSPFQGGSYFSSYFFAILPLMKFSIMLVNSIGKIYLVDGLAPWT